MRILFIGGTRFIGLHAVRTLAAAGHDVAVFHRGQTRNDLPEDIQTIQGDVANLDDFRTDFQKIAPDVVVHMLLMEQGDAMKMIRVFRGIAGRAVVISSMDVYRAFGRLLGTETGPVEPTPLTEQSALREERYPYRSKLPGQKDWRHYYDKIPVEQVAMKFKALPATVLRLPMVYGPHDYQRRLCGYLQRMDDKRPAILIDERVAQWQAPRGYVENVAQAIALCATHEAAALRIYHVAEHHPHALTEIEWIRAIGVIADWHGDVIPVAPEKLPAHLRQPTNGQNLSVDISRIRDELGYAPLLDRETALQRTIQWEREHPPEDAPPLDYAAEDAILDNLSR